MDNLNDESLMPYGKYKGVKMCNVPASYLLWLYENKRCSSNVELYIDDNIDVLKSELKSDSKSDKMY